MSTKYQSNQIAVLENGEAYFPAIETVLDPAEHDIYLETYIFENDNTGQRIAKALQRAADRGVKVRKFRPKISPWTLQRRRLQRLHRKIVVVDQKIAFVGGINILFRIAI